MDSPTPRVPFQDDGAQVFQRPFHLQLYLEVIPESLVFTGRLIFAWQSLPIRRALLLDNTDTAL